VESGLLNSVKSDRDPVSGILGGAALSRLVYLERENRITLDERQDLRFPRGRTEGESRGNSANSVPQTCAKESDNDTERHMTHGKEPLKKLRRGDMWGPAPARGCPYARKTRTLRLRTSYQRIFETLCNKGRRDRICSIPEERALEGGKEENRGQSSRALDLREP